MDWSATLLPFLINEMRQETYDLEVPEEETWLSWSYWMSRSSWLFRNLTGNVASAYEVKKVKKKVNVIPEFSSTLTKKLVL